MEYGKLFVKFDERHNKVFEVGGIELIRPDMWVHTEHGGEETRWMTNFNMREVHPQIGVVAFDEPISGYKKGDKLFFHYMAKEAGEAYEIEGDEYYIVWSYHVFFKILDDSIIMADDMYLGEQVYTDAIKTESGIYLTSDEKKKEILKIRILHVPNNRTKKSYLMLPNGYREEDYKINVGDIVCTEDDHQYYLNFDGRDYIKLHHNEIAAKYVEE